MMKKIISCIVTAIMLCTITTACTDSRLNITTDSKTSKAEDGILRKRDTEDTPATLNVMGVGDRRVVITVDNNVVEFFDAQPFIDENGRTQVPIRAISEMLDCNVEWISGVDTAVITKSNGDKIVLTPGSNKMLINENKVMMDTSAAIISDRIYIPIRFVAEALGLVVNWQ